MVRAGGGLQLELRGENEELAAGLTFLGEGKRDLYREKLILLPRKWDRQALRVEKHGREAVIFTGKGSFLPWDSKASPAHYFRRMDV